MQIRAAFSEHTQAIDRKRAELRKLEEGLLKSKKDAEKQAAKLKSMTATNGTNAREAELQVEIDQCMVSVRSPVNSCYGAEFEMTEPTQVLHMPDEHAQHSHHEMFSQ